MFKRFAVIALLACASIAAVAVPKPSEVKAAVASGNYVKAESLLLEVVKEKPSARAHYDLGQVYTFQGKHNLALNEYRQAQVLDPTLKFASNAAEFTKKLGTAQAMVAPPPKIVAQAPPPPIVAYSTAEAQPAFLSVGTPPKKDDSSILPAILVILIIGGVAGGAFYVVTRKKEKRDVEDKVTASRREKNSTLLGFSKQLEDAALIAKTASYNDAQKRQILDRIQSLQNQTRGMLAELKDGKEVSAVRVTTLESHVDAVVEQANNGIPAVAPTPEPSAIFTPKPAPAPTYPPIAPPPTPRKEESVYQPITPPPSPAPGPVYYAPAPAPVVVNSNDGLLTGVVLGSLLSNNHNTHERVVERVVERPRMDTPRYERDDYEDRTPAPYYAPAPTFDSGSNDRDDYAASPPAMDSSSDSNDDDKY